MTTASGNGSSARLARAFCCRGHANSHLFAPIFHVAGLTLKKTLFLTHEVPAGIVSLVRNALSSGAVAAAE